MLPAPGTLSSEETSLQAPMPAERPRARGRDEGELDLPMLKLIEALKQQPAAAEGKAAER